MKKFVALLAGAAAFAGAAWYLSQKKKQVAPVVYSEEFDENGETVETFGDSAAVEAEEEEAQ